MNEKSTVSRRRFIAATAALGASGIAFSPALADAAADLRRRYFELRSRVDGKPAFWLLRAEEFAVIDRRSVPSSRRLVVTANAQSAQSDGSFLLPYAEQIVVTMQPRAGVQVSTTPRINGPFGGRFILNADNTMTQKTTAANGTVATYAGKIALEKGIGSESWVSQNYDILLDRPNGDKDAVNELVMLRPTGPKRDDGFVPAESTATVIRPQLAKADWGDAKGFLVATYIGRKFARAEDMQAQLQGEELAQLQPFFDNWQRLLG